MYMKYSLQDAAVVSPGKEDMMITHLAGKVATGRILYTTKDIP